MNKIIYTVILVLIIACNNTTKKKQDSNNNGLSNSSIAACDSLIYVFYKTKYQYIRTPFNTDNKEEIDDLELKLKRTWIEILNNKDIIIPFLLTFENDSSYSLYYDNKYLYSGFIGKGIPNHIHSLYLIEGIIQKDYLFNKRFKNKLSPKLFFKNDGINFIFDTIKGNYYNDSIYPFHFIPDFINYKTEINTSWTLYKLWFKNGCVGHPLDNTRLKWNTIYEMLYKNDSIPFYISSQNSTLRTKWNLDFL